MSTWCIVAGQMLLQHAAASRILCHRRGRSFSQSQDFLGKLHSVLVVGYYRPSTASAFVTESAQASAGLRLKQSVLDANQHHSAHQAAGSIFGSKPLRPGALKLLTEAAAANGPAPRETLFSGGGMKNPTFLNMKKGAHVRLRTLCAILLLTHVLGAFAALGGCPELQMCEHNIEPVYSNRAPLYNSLPCWLQMRHTRMRRALIPPEFGSGTGYRTMENTMPIRNLLRDPAKLDQFRANGTIEGVHKVTVPVPGCPAKQRTLCAPTEDETLVIQTVGLPHANTAHAFSTSHIVALKSYLHPAYAQQALRWLAC